MSDRGAKRGAAGAPFYAPRRKTSAEIISEARAALYGDTGESSSGAETSGTGALRTLRTRRPFTPRDPQRTLFTDRERRVEPRPPSAFNLKYLAEEAAVLTTGDRGAAADDSHVTTGLLVTEPQNISTTKKKLPSRLARQTQGQTDWSGHTKLPHLNGRSKPLHRRNTTNNAIIEDSSNDSLQDLAHAILVTQAISTDNDASLVGAANSDYHCHAQAADSSIKRKMFGSEKSHTLDPRNLGDRFGSSDIGVKHLSVHVSSSAKSKASVKFENMSILEISEALMQKSRDVDRSVQLMEALCKLVEKSQPSVSLRDFALRALYTHIDNDDERILVAIARAMLTMQVTGAHLAAACKLVFKVARNDKNDHFFRTTNLLELVVEGCGRADPVSEGECCVYGAGALRFLALEPTLRASALAAGALHLAALHLKILNNRKMENPSSVSEHSSHALYQLTGALRNLAGGGGGDGAEAAEFISSGALAELLTALRLYVTDRDVLTNVVRCLSVLSGWSSCCLWLCAAGGGAAHALLSALAASCARPALAVRLAYTLGNMAAAEEHARINIYAEERGIDVLLTIVEAYTRRSERDNRDPDAGPDYLIGSDLGGSDGSNEDVLIKTVRVIANLSLARRVGRSLAETHASRVIRALLECLELAGRTALDATAVTDIEEEGDTSARERRQELATAALATLNNVTFYREPPPPPDPLAPLLERLCRVTCRWTRESGPARCEAVRALGNMSRCAHIAHFMVLEGAVDALVPFLQHDVLSVRCSAAGVLVNLCGSGYSSEATTTAARALWTAAEERDAATAALLTRALWNAHAHQPLSPHLAAACVTALDKFIDDETIFAACEAKMSDRRASDPEISKHHVRYIDNHMEGQSKSRPFIKSYSVDQELHLECSSDEGPDKASAGEDLGFEEGDLFGECGCECAPCRRLATWEELVGVAIPLLEQLRTVKTDASVGTD